MGMGPHGLFLGFVGLWYGGVRMMLRSANRWLVAGALAFFLSAGCGGVPAAVKPALPSLTQIAPPPGRIVYVREGNLWIWQEGATRQLTSGGTWRQPSFSPDGAEIAYVYQEQNFTDIFAMATDGSKSRRLTRGQAARVLDNDWSARPAWSPNGAQIAFVSDSASYFPLVWVMNKDGSGQRHILPSGTLDAADALTWAPDSKRIAVTAMGREPSQIYILELGSANPERFTNHSRGAFDPAWSPDGETIAYIGRDGPQGSLWLRSVEGSGVTSNDKLAFVRSPTWSPDGRFLAVLSAQSGSFEVWVASIKSDDETLEIGEFRQLTREGGIDATSGLSWAK
jgi:TolB protein